MLFGPRSIVPLGVALLSTVAFVGAARAQSSPERRIEALHEQALEAYSNMEMDEAAELLDRALQVAQRSGLSGEIVARLHVTYGTVLVLGQGRLADGREHLVSAARESDTVRPDPMLSAPLLDQVWQDVVSEARPPRGGTPGPGDEGAPPLTFGQGRVVHDPVREQQPGHAVPVYVELQGVRAVRRILLAYRGPGSRGWLTVDMREHGDGFAARIPCHRVRPPELQYFVTATTEDGAAVPGGGSEDDPFRVDVRRELEGSAPRLPGEPPEPPCSEDDRSGGREQQLHARSRLFYIEAQLGTGAGVPFGEEERRCEAGQDLVRVMPSLAWTELVILPELGFYIGSRGSIGLRARLQAPGAVYPDAPLHWGVELRGRWFILHEDPMRVFAHFGAGYGNISHRVQLQPSPAATCGLVHFKTAGDGIVSLGAGLLYDVVRNFAIGAEIGFSMFFPTVAIQGDLTLVLSASF